MLSTNYDQQNPSYKQNETGLENQPSSHLTINQVSFRCRHRRRRRRRQNAYLIPHATLSRVARGRTISPIVR